MRAAIKGLGVTSIKWKCPTRKPRYNPGDPVYARLGADCDPDYGVTVADFPAIVIRLLGSKVLVYVEKDATSESGGYQFEPRGNGFCKVTLSRLKPRTGEPQTICKSCEWPESLGHQEGYSCNPWRGETLHQEYPF